MYRWRDCFKGDCTFGILKYWTNFADSAEVPVSEKNGWKIDCATEGETERFVCSHVRLGFRFELHITGYEDGFEVFLPKDRFQEAGNRAHSLLLLPELCRKTEGDDGYYILPQQSGVLSRFSGKHDAAYQIGIYGNGFSECNMPVYGMVEGDTLFAAIMTEGFCDAALRLETARGPHKAYRLAPLFFLRYELNVRRQDMPRVNDNIRIRFHSLPLNGRSGAAVLAEHYRNHRLAAGEIVPMKQRAAENPVLAEALRSPEIRIRMGVKWPFPMEVVEQTPENEPEVHTFCFCCRHLPPPGSAALEHNVSAI